MIRTALLTGLVLAAPLSGCKPPPSDAAVARVSLLSGARGPSEPLASPDTTRALWAPSAPAKGGALRLVYGVPGQPVLLAVECVDPASPDARLRITRHAPADAGAGALLALVGNGAIGRIAVDAASDGGRRLWRGEAPAAHPAWEALNGVREATATVPGAGLVRLNASPLPMELITACRGPGLPADPA